MILSGWELDEFRGIKLPQKVASAFTAVTGELTGADYQPIVYLGKQVVNGTNYCLLALQRIITAKPEKRLVKMIINEAADGTASLVSVTGFAI